MSAPVHARAIAWWRGRAPRERAMLAVMAALLAAFAWWYGLLWPLRAAHEAAAARHARAVAALQVVEAELAALAAPGGGSGPGDTAGALQHRVLASLRDAGLSPSRQRTAADGALVLEFDRVGSAELFDWLGRLALDHGLAPSSLRVERADGRLRATARFGGGAS